MVNIHELRKNNYELYKKLLCENMLTLYLKYGDRLSIEELQEIKKKYISRKYYQGVVNQNKKLIEKQQKEIKELKWKENEQKELLKYKTDRIDQQQKEIEELKKPKYIIDFKTNKITTLYNNFISKDKIKEFIKKETKQDTYNFDCISAKKLEELLEEE